MNTNCDAERGLDDSKYCLKTESVVKSWGPVNGESTSELLGAWALLAKGECSNRKAQLLLNDLRRQFVPTQDLWRSIQIYLGRGFRALEQPNASTCVSDYRYDTDIRLTKETQIGKIMKMEMNPLV